MAVNPETEPIEVQSVARRISWKETSIVMGIFLTAIIGFGIGVDRIIESATLPHEIPKDKDKIAWYSNEHPMVEGFRVVQLRPKTVVLFSDEPFTYLDGRTGRALTTLALVCGETSSNLSPVETNSALSQLPVSTEKENCESLIAQS